MQTGYSRDDDPLTYDIIGCAIAVHKQLGPGLREAAYEEPFLLKLRDSGLYVRRQPKVRIPFEGRLLNKIFVPDFVIEEEVVVELKSVETLLPLHDAQLLTYMRLAEIPLGLLINFNVVRLTDGIKRLIMTKKR